MGNLGVFHGFGTQGTSLGREEGSHRKQLLLFPYHAISPPRSSQQREHSKGPLGALLLTVECGTPERQQGVERHPQA